MISVWIFQFVLAFSSGIFKVLTPYVTSSFHEHALTATTSVVASIASGIIKLPYAKLLDIWGRTQCMASMVACATVGAVMMATCQNVETYCAAQVFWNVGYYGIQFSLIILIADATPMHHRAFIMGFISTPSVVSIWAYGPAAESVLKSIGLGWGFGIWCILIPLFSSPLLFLMSKYEKQAHDSGLVTKPQSSRTIRQSVAHYCRELDVIGLSSLAAGLSLLLLAISIYSYQPEGWESPMILSFIILGFVLILMFVLYEKYLAPETFFPWALLKDRTVVFTNIMAVALYTSEFVCSQYIYSMLIVSFGQTVTRATYINNIYMVGASIWNLVLGVALRWNGHIKWYAFLLGIPFFILGQGLMISLETTHPSVALMVVCQILISFGGGTMYPIEHMTLMAVSPTHFPALIAIESVVVDIGKGAGAAVSTAMWTSMFRKKLAAYLPDAQLPALDDIYGSLHYQSSYPTGTPAREGINRAYGETQRVIFITATSLLAIAWIAVLFWKDIDVKKPKSQKV